MNYYPTNTVANYVTQLRMPIQLDDSEWEVALVESHYPCSFLSIGVDDKIIIHTKPKEDDTEVAEESLARVLDTDQDVTPDVKTMKPKQTSQHEVTVKAGDYTDIQELLDYINALELMATFDVKFTIDSAKRIEISMGDDVETIALSQTLALQLGFDPNNLSLDSAEIHKSIRPHNIRVGLPAHMYVYCDLVEPQFVGDTVAPLLKIINISTLPYVYGVHKTTSLFNPHYVPVKCRYFESIEIDLRDGTGNHLPFHFGTSCVKLHFRKATQ